MVSGAESFRFLVMIRARRRQAPLGRKESKALKSTPLNAWSVNPISSSHEQIVGSIGHPDLQGVVFQTELE